LSGEIEVSEHAREQASRRGLSGTTLLEVARSPEQRISVRPGREIRQSRITMPPGGKLYLVRVVVDTRGEVETVVTAYRTSRIEKYWSGA
jgi:hypothetical protein